jgi:RNA-splicing ligase RtcB
MVASLKTEPSVTDLVRDWPYRWILPRRGSMRVPGVIFASEVTTTYKEDDVRSRLLQLMAALGKRVPAGSGAGGIWKARDDEFIGVLRRGAVAAVEAGYGNPDDLEHCEDGGGLLVDDVREVSKRAIGTWPGPAGHPWVGKPFH